MKLKSIAMAGLAAAVVGYGVVSPVCATAQNYQDRTYRDRDDRHGENRDRSRNNYRDQRRHRQDTKNEWRNIAAGAGALGVLGALSGDRTLAFAGTAGALYSLNRYEQDRRSQRREERLRAEYFSRSYFYRDGHRYDRRSLSRYGTQYYRFYRRD